MEKTITIKFKNDKQWVSFMFSAREKGKKFIVDQLIKIMFYCNRWRTCGAHRMSHEWECVCVSQIKIVLLYWYHLNGLFICFVSIQSHRPCCIEFNTFTQHGWHERCMCVCLCLCVCACVFIFGWISTEQMRRVANRWQTHRNDDVCKGNFSWWQQQ